MKSRIVIEIDTVKMNKFFSEDVNGVRDLDDEITDEIEKSFHRMVQLYIENRIINEDFEFECYDQYADEAEAYIEDFDGFSSYGEISISCKVEDVK